MKREDKIKDFKKMEKKELMQLLTKNREKLLQIRFDMVSGKNKNIKEIKEIKKDIARIMTLLDKEALIPKL
ncbi:50S ribosomal protein L29 [bacterium (Candidatus Gribaldobacteria) CG_4_10_14_0_8_um_filter_33_9]|uniref:Large ribosomal subunit protein uL29 n=1 Tax=bacterium (Candidatus Gribaldobacteria) CG_4_10_14_0_8_um_filter_33_9 TaxID=2014266 RepID=A0A2M7RNL4_9BACT|nr:MAG: 50S ribosomal protein L29 [bacterium (Candidatus Gribaldobacteria) CG_4_10_14_0_8_um_filter_33_9]